MTSRTFEERQNDVFASLASLEAAHKAATRSTRAERQELRKTVWRHPTPVVEDLEEERELRQSGNSVRSIDHNVFRRPVNPPPRHRNRPPPRRPPSQQTVARDPQKWIHYDLRNVDEDAGLQGRAYDGDSNMSIALSFISELRARRDSSDNEQTSNSDCKPEHRILFRPTRVKKRARMDPAILESQSAGSAISVPEAVEDADDTDLGLVDDTTPSGQSSTFTNTSKKRRQIRGRSGDQDDGANIPDRPNQPGTMEVDDHSHSSSNNSTDCDEDLGEADIDDHLA